MTPVQMAALSAIREQAAAQGITWVGITGDAGAYNCLDFHTITAYPVGGSTVSVNARASSPYVIAVGGTEFDDTANPKQYWASMDNSVHASALSYIPEVAWNDSCIAGAPGCASANLLAGAGGPSTFYPKPAWQTGIIGIPSDGWRDMPDLSLTASNRHEPYLLCVSGSCAMGSNSVFKHVGGTSAAAPSFAGIMALIDENQEGRQGAVNPILYLLAATQNYAQCDGSNLTVPPIATCIFHDVTRGTTALAGAPNQSLYPASPGYDFATGLGSINVANLVQQWPSKKIPTTLALSTSASFPIEGISITLAAVVKSAMAGAAPTGVVTFFNGPSQIATPVTVAPKPGALPQSIANLTTSSLTVGANPIIAAYSGDAVYMPSVASVLSVNASSAAAGCPVADFIALPNPAPLTGEFGITTLFADAPCNYDIRVGSASGPLFASATGFSTAATAAWVTENMSFYLQKQGDLTSNGTLAATTVRLQPAPLTDCYVSEFEASPNPIPSTAAMAMTTILANATCAYDIRVGSTTGQLFAFGVGATQNSTGPWVTDGLTFFMQRHNDMTPQGTLRTLTVGVRTNE